MKKSKNKKKIWVTLAIIAGAILLSGGVFGIARMVKQSNCEHEFGLWEVREAATCTEAGEERRECALCGKKEDREIKKLGHEQRMLYAVEATCTKAGRADGVQCTRCKKILAGGELVPAKGHIEVTIPGTPAGCLTDGVSNGTKCGRCDEVLVKQKTIAATGHSIVTIEGKAPTCDTAGYSSTSFCLVCEEVYTPREEYAALGHVVGGEVVELEMYSDTVCERCNMNARESYLSHCQDEALTTATPLAHGEVSTEEIAGAYRYTFTEKLTRENYAALLFENATVTLDGEATKFSTVGVYITPDYTQAGKIDLSVYLIIRIWAGNIKIELDSYYVAGMENATVEASKPGYVDFYLLGGYNCDVIVTDSEGVESTQALAITFGDAIVVAEDLQKVELNAST